MFNRADDLSSYVDRVKALRMIDRKLTGDRRAQAMAWVRSAKYGSRVRELTARLEKLPDIDRGGQGATARLSPAEVIAIRSEREQGATLAQLAKRHGVSTGSISRICRGKQQAGVHEVIQTDNVSAGDQRLV